MIHTLSVPGILATIIVMSNILPPVVAAGGNVSMRRIEWNPVALSRRALYQAQRPASGSPRPMPVFTGDWVVPQFVDGGSWQTTIKLANLDTQTARLSVYFTKDDGTEMQTPIVGLGPTAGIEFSLPPNTTIDIETEGSAAALSQGWAIVVPDDYESFGGFAVFRQRSPGRPDSEAIVPLSSVFVQRMILMYDNTGGFVTSMALVNPDISAVFVNATIRDTEGNVLGRETDIYEALQHTAFALPSKWPSTAGKKGSIELMSTGGISALGLRFSPNGPFTSFHTLTNSRW